MVALMQFARKTKFIARMAGCLGNAAASKLKWQEPHCGAKTQTDSLLSEVVLKSSSTANCRFASTARFARHGQLRLVGTLVACLLSVLVSVVPAQEATGDGELSAEKPAKTSPAVETSDNSGKKTEPGLLVFGEEKKRILEGRNSPDYSITSITLEGLTKDNGSATLTATIAIQINRDDTWLRIPLNLNEATLTGHRYQGEGTATPDDNFTRETGYFWWLRGKGDHILTLSMIVPIKKQLPSRRLQLTVPATAVSRLKLHVPIQRLSTKVLPKGSWVKTTSLAKLGTNLEVQWFGRRLDVSWEPLAEQGPVETVLWSKTAVKVELTGESVVLEATQQIQALQGVFSKVNVRLPAGFELLYVEGKAYSKHQLVAGTHATVTLSEQTKGPIELKWTLVAPFPGSGGKLTLEGFEVDRARTQTGELAISGLDGFRITRREKEDRYVRRMNVGDLVNGERATTAYSFMKQPFRLVLDLQEIKPGFTVKPKLRLRMSPDRAQLDASFTFQVYRGAVREIVVHWPNAAKEGWNIETVGPPELLNRDQADERLEDGLLRIPLLRRKTGTFELQLKASRPITAGESVPISLPYVEALPRQPTILDLLADENVEVELSQTGTNGGRLPALSGTSLESLPEELRPLMRATYRIDEPENELTSKVIVHERDIATRTTSHIKLNGKKLLVTQRITYNVAFERLAQVLLLVPNELGKRVHFTLGDDVDLSPNSTPLDEGTFHEVRLILPDPQIGEFDIVARFTIDVADVPTRGSSTSLTLPLVQSSDSPLASTRLEWDNGGGLDVVPVDEQLWESQPDSNGSSVWLAEGAPRSAVLKLSDSIRKWTQDFKVRKVLIRTVVDSNGVAQSLAQFRIDGTVSSVSLILPPDKIVMDAAWWGSRQLAPDEIIILDADSGFLRLEDSEIPSAGTRLVTVKFHSAKAAPLQWSRPHQLVAPHFTPGVWVEESIWQVSLPGNQLLFTQPAEYTPGYRWQRRGLLWSRQPLPSHAGLDEWIDTADGPAEGFEIPPGNSYRFSRFGPAASLSCRTMSLPIVVFLGAGLSLAAGFVLLYVPLTRNVLTFLFIAFAVSAIALWFPAPVQLLLQPAVLGLLLAVVAASINSVLRREKRVPVLTLSSPSDLNARLSSLSSAESAPVRGPGSEDPTVVRPAVAPDREAMTASESGSHV
jgi:hypothetical protein